MVDRYALHPNTSVAQITDVKRSAPSTASGLKGKHLQPAGERQVAADLPQDLMLWPICILGGCIPC